MKKFESQNSMEIEGLRMKERALYFKALYEAGPDFMKTSEIVGFHGTSIEVIKRIIEKGTIPGGTEKFEDKELSTVGSLYFYPKVENFPDKYKYLLPKISPSNYYPFPRAESYARILGPVHRLAKVLGIPLNKIHRNELFNYLFHQTGNVVDIEKDKADYIDIQNFSLNAGAKSFNMKNSTFRHKIFESERFPGVVLGIKKSILDAYKVKSGDERIGGDMRVFCPNGVDYIHVGAIFTEGTEEKKFFENLD